MDLYRVLRLSIFLIVASGGFAISIAEQDLRVIVFTALAGLLVYRYSIRIANAVRQEFLFSMMLALVLWNFWTPHDPDRSDQIPLAFAHFLIQIQVLVFFMRCGPSLLLTLCGVSSLAVIIISGVVQGDATMLLRMACLVGLTAWALYVYSLWRTREGFVGGTQTLSGWRAPAGLRTGIVGEASALPANAFWQGLALTGSISCACLGLGLMLFFSAPRMNERLAALIEIMRGDRDESLVPVQSGGRRTSGGPTGNIGWDEKLSVNTSVPIEANQQYALTVTFSAPPASIADVSGRIYLRGMAYSEHEQGVWTAAPPYRRLETHDNEYLDIVDPSDPAASVRKPDIKQTVLLYTLSQVYFGMAPIVRVGTRRATVVDMEGGLREAEKDVLDRYDIWSQAPVYQEQVPEQAQAEHEALQRYVRSTGLRVDIQDEVKALALKITDNASSSLKKARAIMAYLKDESHCRYTLKLDELHRVGDPIYEFLLSKDASQRRGHCQYFASAFAVLCRLSGIPARVASGFVIHLPPHMKSDDRSLMVQNKNAHAWGEVYFRGIGWVIFDPVPSSAENATGSSQIAANQAAKPSQAGAESDGLVAQAWNSMMGYNSLEQQKVYKQIGDAMTFGMGNLGVILFGRNGGWVGTLLTWILLSLVLSWMLHLLIKRPRTRVAKTGAGALRARAAVAFYNDLLQVLSRRGFVRRTGQTPREFAELVIKRGGTAFQPALVVTEVFETVRYGGGDLSQDEFNRLQTALDSLRELTFAGRETDDIKSRP